MASIPPRLRRILRSRLALAMGGALVLGAVVLENQPPSRPASPVAVAQATAPAGSHARAATRAVPGGVEAPPFMHLLHDSVSLRDDSAAHPGAPALAADTGILIDLDARTILWERDPHLPHAPASTTKVLSTLVALENFAPDRLVTITPDALAEASDETVMGLIAGQRLTVEELLQGMLLVSGNDAANAMAADTVGFADFVATMNAQVQALGLHDSHFTTPVGLDDPQQLASAYDLAVIAMEDVNHFPLFRQIVSERAAELPASPLHADFKLTNLNRLLAIYAPAVGIKPGWTGAAGPCLVSMAVRGDHRLIAVLMNAPKLYDEARALLDWGFGQEGLPSAIPPGAPN